MTGSVTSPRGPRGGGPLHPVKETRSRPRRGSRLIPGGYRNARSPLAAARSCGPPAPRPLGQPFVQATRAASGRALARAGGGGRRGRGNFIGCASRSSYCGATRSIVPLPPVVLELKLDPRRKESRSAWLAKRRRAFSASLELPRVSALALVLLVSARPLAKHDRAAPRRSSRAEPSPEPACR